MRHTIRTCFDIWHTTIAAMYLPTYDNSDGWYCFCHYRLHSSQTPYWQFASYRSQTVVGLVGNVVGRINEVNQHRARLVPGWVTVCKTSKPSLHVTSHPGQLSLAIPLRVGKMSTGDDYGHCQGRNGEFCVTVGPATRTADIPTQSVIWRTWAVC